MKVYSTFMASPVNGLVYGVRLLLTDEELAALRKAEILGNVAEVIGMQHAADLMVAELELECHTATGGVIQ